MTEKDKETRSKKHQFFVYFTTLPETDLGNFPNVLTQEHNLGKT